MTVPSNDIEDVNLQLSYPDVKFEALLTRTDLCPTPGKFKLNILHLNIRGIRKHYDELISFINGIPTTLTVIALSELQLPEISCEEFPINGYKFIKKLREDSSGGGIGVTYLKDQK